jgi:hypothetical protein
MTVTTNLKQLYETDEHLWLLETIELLKQKRLDELDIENLIGELESLGRSERNAVESLLEQIIRHLLLLQYWTVEYDRNVHHWEAEIIGFRGQLTKYLTTNLHKHLEQELNSIYILALKYVTRKTNQTVNFPRKCPYTLEQLSDTNYLPNQER